MKESYWTYWLVLLGVFIIGVMLLVNNISTTNTQDYYNIKEVTQASLIDAVDFSYYRLYGNLKISEQKFVENFARRFAENLNIANDYDVEFYDLYEVPPKVSVKISSGTRAFNIGNSANNSYDVVTTISQILQLGKYGEKINENTNSQSKCKLHVTTQLMEYFKGNNINGHLSNKEGLISNPDSVAKTVKDMTLQEFKSWFLSKYKIDGNTVSSKYFASHSSSQLNDAATAFISRGWLELDK